MARPPSLWLAKAYDILGDGRWHVRDDVLAEMVKGVPPAVAYRRGIEQSQNPDAVTREQLIRRGARQICQSSLNGAGYIESATRRGQWVIRLQAEYSRRRARQVVLHPAKGRADATHMLVPISCYKTLAAKHAGDIVFVREP